MAEVLHDDLDGQGQSITDNVTQPSTSNTLTATTTGTGTLSTTVFSSDAALTADSTYGLKQTCSANYFYCKYDVATQSATEWWQVFYLQIKTTPTGNYTVANIRNGSTILADLRVTTGLLLNVRDNGLTGTDAITGALSLNTTYRVAWGVDLTDNSAILKLYSGDSLTALSSSTDTTMALNSQTQITTGIFGVGGSATVTQWIDDFHAGTTEWLPTVESGGNLHIILGQT